MSDVFAAMLEVLVVTAVRLEVIDVALDAISDTLELMFPEFDAISDVLSET